MDQRQNLSQETAIDSLSGKRLSIAVAGQQTIMLSRAALGCLLGRG